jgi:hypothetical protein
MPQVKLPDPCEGLGCGRFSVCLPTQCAVYPDGDPAAADATDIATQKPAFHRTPIVVEGWQGTALDRVRMSITDPSAAELWPANLRRGSLGDCERSFRKWRFTKNRSRWWTEGLFSPAIVGPTGPDLNLG